MNKIRLIGQTQTNLDLFKQGGPSNNKQDKLAEILNFVIDNDVVFS